MTVKHNMHKVLLESCTRLSPLMQWVTVAKLVHTRRAGPISF